MVVLEIYYNFAEFYYRRESYRNALRHYNQAYKHGFDTNYNTLYKMGDIYEKFGDSRSALKYFKEDPYFRGYHTNLINFSMYYFFSTLRFLNVFSVLSSQYFGF